MSQEETQSRDDLVDEVIAAYLQAVEMGEKPDRRKFLAEHAEIARELESFFDNQSEVQQFVGEADSRCDAIGQLTAEQLMPLFYDQLRKLAAARLAKEKPGQTLDATALVHEVYLKLARKKDTAFFANARHFFGAAAEAMRQVLVDRARHKLSIRHGGEWQRVAELRDVPVADVEAEQTIIIHEMLDQLAENYARQSQVMKMRLFLRFNFVEIAKILGLSTDTVESDWAFARAWLKRKWAQNHEKSES